MDMSDGDLRWTLPTGWGRRNCPWGQWRPTADVDQSKIINIRSSLLLYVGHHSQRLARKTLSEACKEVYR